MRGLLILAVILIAIQKLSASTPREPQAPIPMHTGRSALLTNEDIARAASRCLVLSRISTTLNRADTAAERERILAQIEEITRNPAIREEIANVGIVDEQALLAEIRYSTAQIIRPRLPLNLRVSSDDFILSSGFTAETQDNFPEAGCYIRLGQNLRSKENSRSLASEAFLRAGILFATVTSDKKSVDSLLSAAECYYWAYCNEQNPFKKTLIKKVSVDYFDFALTDAKALNDTGLITKIQQEKEKLR